MLLDNKIALITGITNEYSIAYHIASSYREQGAQVILTYQGQRLHDAVQKIADKIGAAAIFELDATDEAALDNVFGAIEQQFGGLDIFVHAIAFAPKNELTGGITNATREGFSTTVDVSSYTLISMSKRAAALMRVRGGGSIMTLTYIGAERALPSYNAMGCAKAALESAMRYLAFEMGADKIRVNALSCAPIKTVAARSIPGFMDMYNSFGSRCFLQRNITGQDVAGPAVFLVSDMSQAITGTVIYVDGGFHSSAMM
jgi:enoyl-[acyl-carrier protein] reductase I